MSGNDKKSEIKITPKSIDDMLKFWEETAEAYGENDRLRTIATEIISSLVDRLRESKYETFCPYDNKYKHEGLVPFLSYAAEWRYGAKVLAAIVKGMHHFGLATQENVEEIGEAVDMISPANCVELEGKLRHDMRGLKKEMLKYISEDTAMKMYPGTTSFDILDTARSWMYMDAMNAVILPEMKGLLKTIVSRAEEYSERIQIGRTHGQHTSPVLFGYVLACFADRLADRIENIGTAVSNLEGKISGIVGTNASIQIVLGKENDPLEFERYVLEKVIGLKVCEGPSQIVPKDKLGDLVHYLCSFDGVLADMANSFRHLQRSEINEITEKKKGEEGGGSSADPSKTNPINSENINGIWEVIINSIHVLYHMQVSDHQRDLRGSVQARFEPVHTMCGVYESTNRMAKVMKNLAVYDEMMDRNLEAASTANSEYMNAVMIHHGIDGYEAVKQFSITAKKEGRGLLGVAMENPEFRELWEKRFLPEEKQLLVDIKSYTGNAYEKTMKITMSIRGRFRFEGSKKDPLETVETRNKPTQ